MANHPREADLLRVARRYRAAGYVIRRVDERGVLMAKRDLANPIALILFGWLYAITRVGRRDQRVLLTTNEDGRIVVLGEGRDPE